MFRIIPSIALLSSVLVSSVFAQAPKDYTLPTPMASQFEKYINYPVDHSTGAASVDIPLYTLKAGSIQVPVSLSYHTGGVKPEDPSIPFGLGWTLNPGARVTRMQVKYPDEAYAKPNFSGPPLSFVETSNLEYSPNAFEPSSNRNAIWDGEYDIFTYYTGTGIQGRFIIQQQGGNFVAVPLVLTRDKINVHIVPGPIIDYIEITDPNGILYRFGAGISSYSTQAPVNSTEYNTSNATINIGWMLTDIISADKADTIGFTWKRVTNNISSNYVKKVLTDKVIITDNLELFALGISELAFGQAGYNSLDFSAPDYMDSYSNMDVIAGIKYRNQEVKMIYTSGFPTVLTNIEIYSHSVKQRQIDIQTSYFPGNNHKRLDCVSIRDKDVQLVNKYCFGYNEQVQLPWELSRAIDFWGYYNGGESNTTIVPNFPITVYRPWVSPYLPDPYTFNTGSYRGSNTDASAYILNSVTYPTGGKTTYDYENNQVLTNGVATATGGLRVQKIRHWSSDGQLAETRTYTYGINECGYGDGVPLTANMFVEDNKIINYFYPGASDWFAIYRKRVIHGSPVNAMFMSLVPPVSYQEVTEYVGNNTGNNTGKIVYRYSAAPLPVNSTLFQFTAYAYVDKYWQKPVLTSTTSFKNEGGTYKIVNRQSADYFNFESAVIPGLFVRRYAYYQSADPLYPPQTLEFYHGPPYFFIQTSAYPFEQAPVYLHCGIKAPESEKIVQFTDSGDSIVVKKTYSYANNDYLYPTAMTVTNSDGSSTVSHFKYPKDYTVGSSPTNTVAQGIKLLMDRNVVAPVVEEYTELQPDNIVKSGSFTTFKTNLPVPDQVFGLKPVTTPGAFTPATITSSAHTKSSSYDIKSTINLYDVFGHVRQATDETAGISTVVLYSYNGQFPIAVIKNATFTSVAAAISGGQTAIDDFALGYPTSTEVNNFLSTIRSSLPQAFIITYTIDPFLGVTSQKDENGRTTYYEYDAAGRLQLIKDKDGYIIKTFEYKYKQ